MARFYGSMQGNRGQATRQGFQDFRAHIRGWDSGIQVYLRPGINKDEDVIEVYQTGGSNNSRNIRLLAKIVNGQVVDSYSFEKRVQEALGNSFSD